MKVLILLALVAAASAGYLNAGLAPGLIASPGVIAAPAAPLLAAPVGPALAAPGIIAGPAITYGGIIGAPAIAKTKVLL